MSEVDTLYWYEFDVLPVVGFVRAPDAESAKAAALDDAVSRIGNYLNETGCTLSPVLYAAASTSPKGERPQ